MSRFSPRCKDRGRDTIILEAAVPREKVHGYGLLQPVKSKESQGVRVSERIPSLECASGRIAGAGIGDSGGPGTNNS
jgi:hypothetical protein